MILPYRSLSNSMIHTYASLLQVLLTPSVVMASLKHFQRRMSEIQSDLDGTASLIDNVLVDGETQRKRVCRLRDFSSLLCIYQIRNSLFADTISYPPIKQFSQTDLKADAYAYYLTTCQLQMNSYRQLQKTQEKDDTCKLAIRSVLQTGLVKYAIQVS